MDRDAELVEIEYGYATRDRPILMRATLADVHALVAEVARRGGKSEHIRWKYSASLTAVRRS